ncbi:MBL fold metallo-hydrolase [uncultured Thalassospira sp.]|jgi:glyoxylase-like metal-dependent hydrolase (beta-lactamase superfamily II)|uniref:MBL fold metallo-hydrolase n=1 Tax=uncultured Thalassospira sp. TaxID=404382 RepID=UPI0030DC1212|tara:strand:- start:6973 stop:7878 length:906 start_codon:yes stop_codon:yes gene_type:complete
MTIREARPDAEIASRAPLVKAFFDPATFTVSYVVRDPQSPACAIVDSVLDYDPAAGRTSHTSADAIVAYVRDNHLTVEWILETHVHADHLSAAPYLKQKLGGKMAIGAHITVVQDTFGKIFNAGTEFARDGRQFDRLLNDGDQFDIGALQGRAIHTPGHTPACMSYLIGDAVFVGDTLFMPDYGTARCDFPGGDAHMLYQSARRLLALPGETRMFMCHDYKAPGRDDYCWETTVAEERSNNIHLNEDVSEDEFVSMRTDRDATLGMPRLILPSVQVNMRAGELPPAEDNGIRYIKVPLNVL